MRYTHKSKVAINTRVYNGNKIGSVPNKSPINPSPINPFLHWQTVKETETGANAETYAADAGSHMFRHETADDYFDYKDVDEDERWVRIYKP